MAIFQRKPKQILLMLTLLITCVKALALALASASTNKLFFSSNVNITKKSLRNDIILKSKVIKALALAAWRRKELFLFQVTFKFQRNLNPMPLMPT